MQNPLTRAPDPSPRRSYMLLFVSFIKGAGETGVDVNAMLFWLPFQGIATGLTIMICVDEYGI